MKSLLPALVALASFLPGTRVNADVLRDWETLRTQRDRAVENATQPIRETYLKSLRELFDEAMRANEVETAAKLKAELEAAEGVLSPASVVGTWKLVDSQGKEAILLIQPEGKGFYLSSDGKSFPNVWKIDGRKLIMGPDDDRDGRFTTTFTFDGDRMDGEGGDGTKGRVATRVR